MKALFLLLMLMIALPIWAQEEHTDSAVVFLNKSDLFLIGKKIYILEDEIGNLEIEDILKPEYQTKFYRNDKDIFAHPPSFKTFWFKISIQNLSHEKIWIELGSSYLWYIDYYVRSEKGYFLEIQTGSFRAESQKPYPVNLFWLPVYPSEDIQTIYIRIKTEMTFEAPIHLGSTESLSLLKSQNDYVVGGFVGLVGIMFFYNLFLLWVTKDNVYGWYIGYLMLITFVTTFLNHYPLIRLLLPESYRSWWYLYFPVWHGTTYFFMGNFAIYFLHLHKAHRKITVYIRILVFILSLIFPLINLSNSVPTPILASIFMSFILLFLLSLLGISIYVWVVNQERIARFYVLAWVWVIMGTSIFILASNGGLPYTYITRNAMFFGVSLEILMFSLALGDRINFLRQEKERIQEENFYLIKEQNTILEEKVKQRTIEIQQQNEEIKLANEELLQLNNSLESANQEIEKQKDEIAAQAQHLERFNALKDKLFVIIAHDLRSPLATLKSTIDIFDLGILSPDELRMIKRNITKQFDEVNNTLQNLLLWAGNQIRNRASKPEIFSIHQVVEEGIAFLNKVSEQKNIRLLNQTSAEIYTEADINEIRTVVNNLISNAIKFTPSQGSITIFSRLESTIVCVGVKDTGVGMNKEQVGKLFSHTTHFSTKGTNHEKGTGFGLLLCKDFIEKNNGSIWVESEEGKGSTFFFSLPRKEQKDTEDMEIV